jgi:hypothetical protein
MNSGAAKVYAVPDPVPLHDNNRKFLHIPFASKGIDAINISNILNRKEVVKEIPPYFKNQSVPGEKGSTPPLSSPKSLRSLR